jgi:LmbE family N-acetylglucosaminyl deacetylase
MADTHYEHTYLSPHLDDAVLSCGGQIYQQCQAGRSVLVFTLMAGDAPPEAALEPFVAELHARWGLAADPNPSAGRRDEDREALAVLGADARYGEWLDCIYRRHPDSGAYLYHSESALFNGVHAVDRVMIPQMVRHLAELPLAPGGRVYAPLTIGGHVDHQLVRQAAEIWGPPEGELVYFEDYPYAERPAALKAVLGPEGDWQAGTVPLNEEALAAKGAAITRYRSQLSTFFVSTEEIDTRVRAYAAAVGGGRGYAERFWRRETDSLP